MTTLYLQQATQPTGLFLYLSVRLFYFLHPFLGKTAMCILQNVISKKSEVENEPDHHFFYTVGRVRCRYITIKERMIKDGV